MRYLFITFFSLFLVSCYSESFATDYKTLYWQTQRKGANFFNKIPREEWFIAAKEAGIEFARLAPE